MTANIDREFIQKMFPTLTKMTYLNTAATGIPPVPTIQAMNEYLDNRTKAIGTFEDTLNTFKEIRSNLANLLGGNYDQYGFVPSTSSGVNSFAHAVQYEQDSNIVICDIEFPANYVPWQNICKLNKLELRVVKSKNGAVSIEDFNNMIDENTKIVAISHVQFGTGFRTDVAELAKIIHEKGGYLLTDIIQSAGWANINLEKMNVDFATAQAAKWLIGPIGAGFCYLKKEIADKLKPKFLGWWGVKNIHDFGYAEREVLDDARMFQVGSPAMVAYVGLGASLKVLLEIPAEKRESAALDNGEYLRKRLEEENIEYFKFDKNNESPIVSCKPEGVDELNKTLNEKKIFCSVRNGRLRVSPHFYNTKDEIDHLIEMMRNRNV